jgi:putative ABC transport system permease protein
MFWRRKQERELTDELRHHIEAQAEMYVREGLTAAEARRRAQLELGGVEQVKEGCREVRMGTRLELFWQDVKQGARALRKTPGFTAVALVTLALGIGANTVMFSVVQAVLLRPLSFPDPGQLVLINESNLSKGWPSFSVTPPAYTDWRRMNTVFTDMAAYRSQWFNLTGSGDPERLAGARVSAQMFATVGVQPLAGRLFLPEEDAPGKHLVALINESLWRRKFNADPAAVGQVITMNGQPYTIVGVIPTAQAFPRPSIAVWAPLAFRPDEIADSNRGSHYLGVVVARMKPGVTAEQAGAEMRSIAAQLERQYPQAQGWSANVVTLYQAVVGRVEGGLKVLFGAVGIVLLIACANMANLMLVRGAARQREAAIQSALGATRGRLVRRMLTESVLLSLGGAAAGVALAWWGADLLRASGASLGLPRAAEIAVDPVVLLFTLTIAVTIGLLFGVLPAWHFSRANAGEALKEGARTVSGGGQRWRGALVVVQVSLALVLLVGAGLLMRSLAALRAVDPGFRPEGLLAVQVNLPNARYADGTQTAQFFHRALESLRALPGVDAAAAVSVLPLSGADWMHNIGKAGEPQSEQQPSVQYATISPGYFRAMGVPILQGRDFTDGDALDKPRVVIINRTLAERFYPGQNPIGQRVQIGRNYNVVREIVGVVGEVKRYGLGDPSDIQAYEPAAQLGDDQTMTLLLRTSAEPAAVAPAVRRAIWAIDPELPLDSLRPMPELVSATMAQPKFRTALLGLFAGLALLLAAVGLYGVLAYAVTQRTREIGIRMALGATRAEILRMVAGQGLRLTFIGVVAGVGGALWLSRFVEKLLFSITPTDPFTFVALPLVLLLVALMACWVPARRATRVDPLVALRYE